MIFINFLPENDDDDDSDEARMPDWEILTRILAVFAEKVYACLSGESYDGRLKKLS
jgi:hypothetical protein